MNPFDPNYKSQIPDTTSKDRSITKIKAASTANRERLMSGADLHKRLAATGCLPWLGRPDYDKTQMISRGNSVVGTKK